MTPCDLFEREGLLQLERGVELDPHFESCPDCLEARRIYGHLSREITELDSGIEPSPAWKARVWAKIDQQRDSAASPLAAFVPAPRDSRRWIRWLAPVGAIAALAMTVVWLVRTPGALSLTAEISGGQTAVRRGEDAHRGDNLRVSATIARYSHAELRVYLNDSELSAACSAETSCAQQGGVISMTTVMRSLGTYRPVLIVSNEVIPKPLGNLDQDAAAALRAGALVRAGDPIPVR